MEMYEGYHILGMHLIWWFVWIIFLFWVFAIPYRIPGQRSKYESALDILKKRLVRSEITIKEYQEMKELITKN